MLRLRLVLLVWYWRKRYGSKDTARAILYRQAIEHVTYALNLPYLRAEIVELARVFDGVAAHLDYKERVYVTDIVLRNRYISAINAAKEIAATLRGF